MLKIVYVSTDVTSGVCPISCQYCGVVLTGVRPETSVRERELGNH